MKVAICQSISPFIIEGAEESASTDLDKYLAKHKKHLRGADLLVWEQGTRNNQGQLEISGGSKGIVTFDMVVKSAESGYSFQLWRGGGLCFLVFVKCHRKPNVTKKAESW